MSRVELQALLDAYSFVSWDAAWEAQAFLDRETGKTYLVSDAIDMDEALEELPDDLDSERYLEIPRRSELDLGKPLVLAFVAERLPGELDRVEAMFRRRGAYRRYKDLLEEKGLLDAWHAFEEQAERRALVEWCQEQGIEVSGWAEDPSVSRARTGSLTAGIPRELPEELAEVLVGGGATRVERIVSRGHASAPGFWYDQDQAELVLLVQGRGAVELEGHEEPIVLGPGEWLDIPAHCRHRVAWTDAGQDTIWLAVFYTQ